MDDTDEKLVRAAQSGPAAYYAEVLAHTRTIHARLNAPDKLTACIVGSDVARLKELLSASLILNDCTSIAFDGTGDLHVTMPEPFHYRSMFGVETVRFNVSQELIEKNGIDPHNPSLRPCFIYSQAAAQRPLMNALLPFIKRGSVVFQPSRGILTKKAEPNSWHVIGVDASTPLDLWEPDDTVEGTGPKRLEVFSGSGSSTTLFEVTLPFLRGVPMRELDAMLHSERDLVLTFRAAVRTAVREATASGAGIAELVNDVVNPAVVGIERRLRSLQRIHRIRVGGAALGSVALAFSTAAVSGGIGASLLAVASAGGFGFAANQYSDYLEKRDELKRDPYYFLWKLRSRVRADA